MITSEPVVRRKSIFHFILFFTQNKQAKIHFKETNRKIFNYLMKTTNNMVRKEYNYVKLEMKNNMKSQ